MRDKGRRLSWHFTAIAAMAVAIGTGVGGCDDGDGGLSTDVGDNDAGVVVCLGDSITAATRTTPYPGELGGLIGKTAVNGGKGGDRAADGAARVSGLLSSHKPGYLTILLGSNDAIHATDSDIVTSALTSIISEARANSTIPILSTIPPMIHSYEVFSGSVSRMNDVIKTVATDQDVAFVDVEAAFNSDPDAYIDAAGLHPNQAGQDLIAATFASAF